MTDHTTNFIVIADFMLAFELKFDQLPVRLLHTDTCLGNPPRPRFRPERKLRCTDSSLGGSALSSLLRTTAGVTALLMAVVARNDTPCACREHIRDGDKTVTLLRRYCTPSGKVKHACRSSLRGSHPRTVV